MQELQQQLQELQAQQQQAAAKQTVEAAARAAGLQIGARIYQQGSGGQIVVAEVVRYDGQKVVCRCVCRDTLLTSIMPFLGSIRPPASCCCCVFSPCKQSHGCCVRRDPDGQLSYVGNTVAEAAANARRARQLAEQQQKQKQKKKLTPAQQRQQAAAAQRERERVARANGTTVGLPAPPPLRMLPIYRFPEN
eukprot:COSAG06_NODE_11265_length_1535_cov_3.417827_1_plen_192_part_00